MDSAPASNEELGINMDSITANNDDPGIHTGPSTSQTSVTNPRGHLRCVNCGLNVTRIRRHFLEIDEVRQLIQRWVQPQQIQVSSNSLVCHACWTAAWSQIRDPSGARSTPIVGHGQICISCGKSLLRIRSHLLNLDSPREELIRNVIAQKISPRQLLLSCRVCHNCWRRADRAVSKQSSTEWLLEQTTLASSQFEPISLTALQPQPAQTTILESGVDTQVELQNNTTVVSAVHACPTCGNRMNNEALQSIDEQNLSSREPLIPQVDQVNAIPNLAQEEQEAESSRDILLPNYIRAPNTQSRCFFPGCSETDRHKVPSTLRVRLFCDYNYYVPPDCRICRYHLVSSSWDLLISSIYQPIKMFSAAEVEEFASLLKNNMINNLDFDNIIDMPEHIVHYYLGLSKAQFQQILSDIPRFSNTHRGHFALTAYLMKIRTGDSDERLSSLLQVSRSTLERHMNLARDILHQDFVPRNLGIGHISRAEISQRNLHIPNGLYGGEERRPIIIADGTYIYVEKSSNYLYQKQTYSLHKYRNLIKPFLFVCSDGYIIDVLGPYPATTSDANILTNEFGDQNSPLRQYFQPGHVFILDKGFRDSLPLLESCGYNFHVPLSPVDCETQLSTRDANKSRAVTMCRWVVEAVNGIFKTAFKIFRQNYFNRASKHVMMDFSIAAALINKFHAKISNRDDASQILEIVQRNMELPNDLSDYVREHNLNRVSANFRNINVNSENVSGFPVLTYSDLVLIACGTYQIKQSRSYYGEHRRFNGMYRIEVCDDLRSRAMEEMHFGENCFLIRAKISSRHISRKKYFIYILICSNESGRNAIKKYCCNCIVGRRTVGCCAHIMTVIWYLGWARYQSNIFPPAQFLDDVLIVYDDV